MINLMKNNHEWLTKWMIKMISIGKKCTTIQKAWMLPLFLLIFCLREKIPKNRDLPVGSVILIDPNEYILSWPGDQSTMDVPGCKLMNRELLPIDTCNLCRARLALHPLLLPMMPVSSQEHLLTFQLPRKVCLQIPGRDGCVFERASGAQFSD